GLCCPAAWPQWAEKALPHGEGSGQPCPDPQPSSVRVVRDASRGAYGLRAENASLRSISAALERAIGGRIELDETLGARRFTLDLSPRPPERLFFVLARRASARCSVTYRLRRPAAETSPSSGRALATRPVTLRFPQPTPLPEVLRELPDPVKVEEGVD